MIYLLSRPWRDVGYDENVAKVVRAESEAEAREIANEDTSDEGKIWEDEQLVTIVEVPSEGDPEEILVSFLAG